MLFSGRRNCVRAVAAGLSFAPVHGWLAAACRRAGLGARQSRIGPSFGPPRRPSAPPLAAPPHVVSARAGRRLRQRASAGWGATCVHVMSQQRPSLPSAKAFVFFSVQLGGEKRAQSFEKTSALVFGNERTRFLGSHPPESVPLREKRMLAARSSFCDAIFSLLVA